MLREEVAESRAMNQNLENMLDELQDAARGVAHHHLRRQLHDFENAADRFEQAAQQNQEHALSDQARLMRDQLVHILENINTEATVEISNQRASVMRDAARIDNVLPD